MKLRRILLSLVGLFLLLSALAYVFRAEISMAIAQRVTAIRMNADAVRQLPDGLHLGLCGSGSPMPDDLRMGPCTLVVAGKRLFVFDAGNGSSRNIGKMGFVHGQIDAIFLTHFHSDHIDGLGELLLQRWVSSGNAAPVPLYGPPGVEKVAAGIMQAYELDRSYRVAHHGEAILPSGGFGAQVNIFKTPAANQRLVLLKDEDLEVAAFLVDHSPVSPAVGYRISYKGRSIVLSGDTIENAAVQREAAGVDVLVHEAMSLPLMALLTQGAKLAGRPVVETLMVDIQNYHTTPEQAAQTAYKAQARYLLLNHIAPPLPPLPGLEKAFLGDAAKRFKGPIKIGRDGDFISLPAHSDIIDSHKRF
jgi:ribonuclease Z|tara:strand:- start:6405 stop:7487 length:1083 start_codon:yes stop_codon:yes gene_type:complete